MRRSGFRRLGFVLFAGVATCALAGLVLRHHHTDAALSAGDRCNPLFELIRSSDPFEQVAREATLNALDRRFYEEGADVRVGCLDFGDVCAILHPDTAPERLAELRRTLEEFYAGQAGQNKNNYWKVGRWSSTATDGSTGSEGDPITLLWWWLPDGVWIPGGVGEPGSPSILHAVFDTTFNTPDQWKNKMRNAFSRWDDVLGTTYIEVAYDDGATFPNSGGVVGVRPDVRIGGHPIDGSTGILAYNNYPNGGDMVIDTDDNFFYKSPLDNYKALKNVTMHEHGHGFGLGHVIPEDATKLMEGFYSPMLPVGAQDDDIRGGQRLYGDPLENNDVAGNATDLGLVGFAGFANDTLFVENLSIDRGTTDLDWYQVTVPQDHKIDIEVDPIGSTYLLGNQGGGTSWISTDSLSDPDFELYDSTGSGLLAAATSGTHGQTEVLTGFPLPYGGKFLLKVFRKAASGGACQRYTLTVRVSPATDVRLADSEVPARSGLEFSVYPNPFNPKTIARFLVPGAGPFSVDVYDLSGRLVRSIRGTAPSTGWVDVEWDGRDDGGNAVASGAYLMRASAGDQHEISRVTLIR